MELMKRGEVSERVKVVQTLLNVLINVGLDVDDEFGGNTFNAVKLYQNIRCLEVDGVIGVNTASAMLDDLKYNLFKFTK
jgi:peptidoglycan hydrolase-like protein with peptidoglycan-binding domain